METTNVAKLGGARQPADLGLSSLGLIMQLVGSLSLAAMAYLALIPFLDPSPASWYMFLLGATGAVRGEFHRGAGAAVLYGTQGKAKKALINYLGFSALATLVWAFVLFKLKVPVVGMLPILGMLIAWPAALAIILSRPAYRAVLESPEPPNAEDLGFEGAGVLMLILGVIGTLVSGLVLLSLVKMPGGALGSPQGLLLFGVFAMLVARSVIHTIAGFKAAKGVDTDTAGDAAARYYSFGIISSVIAAGALLVLMMMTALHPVGLMMIGVVLWSLLLWPLMLRRYYTEKNFSVLLAGGEGPIRRRAADAGMTALGWILLGLGAVGLAFQLPSLLVGDNVSGLDTILRIQGAPETHSPWWDIGISAVQLWAGIELVRMSDRYKLAATIYGAVATAVTIYLVWPQLRDMRGSLGLLDDMGGILGLVSYGTIALGLVLPVATMILANRKIVPQATARIRAA